MRVDVIMVSDNEAEIHHCPCWLARLLLSRRTTFTPIVRVERTYSHGTEKVWQHKYTGRPVGEVELSALETMPVIGEVRHQLLLAAAQEA